MANQIAVMLNKLKDEQGLTVRDVAKKCGLPEQTLYTASKKESVDKISVAVFLKIAHGLGMTAEQLYHVTNDGRE